MEDRCWPRKQARTSLTLPKAIVARFNGCEYFEVSTDGSTIVLRPLEPNRAALVRDRLSKLGLSEQDVSDAVAWARNGQ